MNRYTSNRNIFLVIDIVALTISFLFSSRIRCDLLVENLGSVLVMPTYGLFFAVVLILSIILSLLRRRIALEKIPINEVLISTFEQQTVFVATYIIMFFLMRRAEAFSRVVIVFFFAGNFLFANVFRMPYRLHCIKKGEQIPANYEEIIGLKSSASEDEDTIRHVYIIGAKSIGLYGGYESFILNLLQQHKNNKNIRYHVACKANGDGYMDLEKLPGATTINRDEFLYCNAHCFMIHVPEKIGPAQAIYYDINALRWCCDHIEKNHIEKPIVYILASRIGPFERRYVQRIHMAEGLVYQNPDGHEDWRAKWSPMIRKYWKLSEQYAIKNADLVVCDSKSIEKYIREEYSQYRPKTTFIAYGSHLRPSPLADNDPKYVNWINDHNLKSASFFCLVGRCVPENNYETIIREFMLSHTKKDLAIITTDNPKMLKEMEQKLHYKKDKRIKFVGTVYDTELLTKIRENSYGYFHGHSVGGTNPSLLEALGATKLNLLYDVGFNREVAEDAALYWSLDEGNLAKLIDIVDKMDAAKIDEFGRKAKKRMQDEYSWEYICNKYIAIFK